MNTTNGTSNAGDYYIALDHANLDWRPADVKKVERMWNQGEPIKKIARLVKRPIKEVFILVYDRLELGFIKEREGGIFGYEYTGKQAQTSS